MTLRQLAFGLCIVAILSSQSKVKADEDDDLGGYYKDIDADAEDDVLKTQLNELMLDKRQLSYDDAWSAFADVDQNLSGYPCDSNSTHIPDIYSTYCWSLDKTEGGECGNYKQEGDCFNREHIWPKSWFGGFDQGDGAQVDLFELWPTDGYVNGLRGNLPLGGVKKDTVRYTSTNGCLIGKCEKEEYNDGECFEVPDSLKGDVARSYFYLSTVYWKLWTCCDTDATDGSDMKPWLEDEMRSWHVLDPVDNTEVARNDAIFNDWQYNRNAFIDHPEWVDQISDF
jgi:endonuclease I